MSAFIPSKVKIAILALTFTLLLFLDAPEYVLCTHVRPDEIHDLPRVCSHEKIVSALIHFERYNRINKILQPYGLPGMPKRMRYGEITKQEGLLFHKHMEIDIYGGDLKRQNRYWESNNPYNSQTYIDDVYIIKSMSQSGLARSIKKSKDISCLLHNPLNTVLII